MNILVLKSPAQRADEISELEALGDAANINTLREWNRKMT